MIDPAIDWREDAADLYFEEFDKTQAAIERDSTHYAELGQLPIPVAMPLKSGAPYQAPEGYAALFFKWDRGDFDGDDPPPDPEPEPKPAPKRRRKAAKAVV